MGVRLALSVEGGGQLLLMKQGGLVTITVTRFSSEGYGSLARMRAQFALANEVVRVQRMVLGSRSSQTQTYLREPATSSGSPSVETPSRDPPVKQEQDNLEKMDKTRKTSTNRNTVAPTGILPDRDFKITNKCPIGTKRLTLAT